MNTKKPTKRSPKNRIPLIPALLAAVVVLLAALLCMLYSSNRADRQDISQIREMIILAGNGVNTPAPVDARTGYVYFPYSKLYYPATSSLPQLLYNYDETAHITHVTTRQANTAMSSKLYAAKDINQLFAKVPAFQACSRGVQLAFQPVADKDLQKVGQKTLADGRTMYVFSETGCSQLDPLANDLLKMTQSYK